MMTLAEIESAIAQLPPEELAKLMAWLQRYRAEMWEMQIKQDLETGRLDSVLSEVRKEYEAGMARPI